MNNYIVGVLIAEDAILFIAKYNSLVDSLLEPLFDPNHPLNQILGHKAYHPKAQS